MALQDDVADLYSCLTRIMRALENRHPVGHDAVIATRRVLKRVNGGVALDLLCRCTACRCAREEFKAAVASIAMDRVQGATD